MKNQLLNCILFFVVLLSGISLKATAQATDVQDSLALVDLYNSTNGSGWSNHANWLTATPVSKWFGIKVTGGRVVSISLTSNKLTGTFPASLGNLSALTNLHAGFNQLGGNIPSFLGNLLSLEVLYLAKDQLSGSIPASLANLSGLTSLDLSNNQLTDSVPSWIGNLSNLNSLSLGINSFTGVIPETLGNLTKLTSLVLASNNLTGSIPSSIGNLVELTVFDVSKNQLAGSIPSSFANLTKLQNFYVDGNKLSGPVPAVLCQGHLNFLSLQNNAFTFDGMECVAQLSIGATYSPQANINISVRNNKLSVYAGGTLSNNTYNWYRNNVQDSIIIGDSTYAPALSGIYTVRVNNKVTTKLTLNSYAVSFGEPPVNVQDSLALVDFYNSTNGNNWTKHDNWLIGPVSSWYGITVNNGRVVSVSLTNNKIAGNIPPSFGNLTALTSVNLSRNLLTGTIPSSLGNLAALTLLQLDLNSLTDSIPSSLGSCTHLTYLSLSGNQLIGNIPSALGNLINLQSIDLSSNQLEGGIPVSFSNLLNLTGLYLKKNKLNDTIPGILGNLSSLTVIDLSSNQLHGDIPSSLGGLLQLTRLVLATNNLSGTLPALLANLPNLNTLDLSTNKFTGQIPSAFGNFAILALLNLSNNLLDGNIPVSLGNLSSLEFLYLSNNKLTGSIPSSLGNLSKLVTLALAKNQLTDSIPYSLGLMPSLSELNVSSNKLTGTIPASIGTRFQMPSSVDLSNNELSGEIPDAFGNLNLESVNLSHNHFSGASACSLVDKNSVNVSYNNFNFTGTQCLAGGLGYPIYAPQATISLNRVDNYLYVSAGGTLSFNTYKWYRNDSLILTQTGDSTFFITSSGKYYTIITNSQAPDLTLYSDTLTIGILPLNLLSFTGTIQKNGIKLQWKTSNEINTQAFIVQRRLNNDFTDIGTINAANTPGTKVYSFTDASPVEGMNYYRLKLLDKDGHFTYSNTINLNLKGSSVSPLIAVYPNPANEVTTLSFNSEVAGRYQVIIADVSGRTIRLIQGTSVIGENKVSINMGNCPTGTYLITLRNDKRGSKSVKLYRQ